jgi:hypothetical protein
VVHNVRKRKHLEPEQVGMDPYLQNGGQGTGHGIPAGRQQDWSRSCSCWRGSSPSYPEIIHQRFVTASCEKYKHSALHFLPLACSLTTVGINKADRNHATTSVPDPINYECYVPVSGSHINLSRYQYYKDM